MGLFACSGGDPLTLTLPDGHAVTATVVTRDEDRRAGLVGRPPLTPHQALLLRSPRTATLCITTAPMSYPIDVLFLDPEGRIQRAACARDATQEDVCADGVRDVLELRPRAGCATWAGRPVGGLP